MLIRLLLLTLLTPLLYVAFTATPTGAKGSSYIVAATLDGGRLAGPVTLPVRLPENLDDMFELDAPHGVDGASLPYALTLHYDFTESRQGKRDWVGRYDGGSTLYFPESMVVGPGVWAAGWYTAVDVLADALSGGVTDASEPTSLPATGARDWMPPRGDFSGAVLLVSGLSLLLVGCAVRVRPVLLIAMLAAMLAVACNGEHSPQSAPARAPTFEGVYLGSDEGKVYTPGGDAVLYRICADGDAWVRPSADDQGRHLVSLGGEFSDLAAQGYLFQPGWLWTFVGNAEDERYALARSGLWAAAPNTTSCDRAAGLTLLIEHEVMEMRLDGETVWIKARYVPGSFQYVEYALPRDIRNTSYQLIAEDGTWVDGCCT